MEQMICAHGPNCHDKEFCPHSSPHTVNRHCDNFCENSRSAALNVKCIVHTLGATGEEVLSGLFPVVKKDINEVAYRW